MITEDQLEQLCLAWFREGGYEYANGYDIAANCTTPGTQSILRTQLIPATKD